jgi:hypothetical protein
MMPQIAARGLQDRPNIHRGDRDQGRQPDSREKFNLNSNISRESGSALFRNFGY